MTLRSVNVWLKHWQTLQNKSVRALKFLDVKELQPKTKPTTKRNKRKWVDVDDDAEESEGDGEDDIEDGENEDEDDHESEAEGGDDDNEDEASGREGRKDDDDIENDQDTYSEFVVLFRLLCSY